MLVLTIRTDKPEAEIGLYENKKQLTYEIWEAHRQLSETIHTKIEKLLMSQQKDWPDIQGIVCFQGPGSFTGLRIGLTVGNALSYGSQIPIVAAKSEGWIQKGLTKLQKGKNDQLALPHYGAPVNITSPRK